MSASDRSDEQTNGSCEREESDKPAKETLRASRSTGADDGRGLEV